MGSGHVGLLETRWPFTPVQWAAVLGSLAVLLWSVPGLIINPDFSTGNAASSVQVLGVDMNGWHAVSGFLVAVPCLLVATRPHLAAVMVVLSAGGLLATGVWALFTTRLAGGLFDFPHNGTDAVLHFGVAAIFLAGAAHYVLREGPPRVPRLRSGASPPRG